MAGGWRQCHLPLEKAPGEASVLGKVPSWGRGLPRTKVSQQPDFSTQNTEARFLGIKQARGCRSPVFSRRSKIL